MRNCSYDESSPREGTRLLAASQKRVGHKDIVRLYLKREVIWLDLPSIAGKRLGNIGFKVQR